MEKKRHSAAVQQKDQPGETDAPPIGVFGASANMRGSGLNASAPMYWMYEMGQAALNPARAMADLTGLMFRNPLNPISHTSYGKQLVAACEMFERTTRRYGKPEWRIDSVFAAGGRVPVEIVPVLQKPFCNLLHFERKFPQPPRLPQPKLLIVAPMSGHYATLLRGTVETMLPNHDVYITEWIDARMVPLAAGGFNLDDYIDYVIEMLHHIGGGAHMMAVCQPSVPVLAAVALMEQDKDPAVPASMVLMGGPIDTRINPNGVNTMAVERGLEWFRSHVISKVPFPNPGFMRAVYPGFLQLSGFMSMNMERHIEAHRDLYQKLIKGDGEGVNKQRAFYDEYLAVMDLDAEFYLQTVDAVFIRFSLPKGELMHRDRRVDPSAIMRTALMTVEGENDDISGVGQTEAAHKLCPNIPAERKVHYLAPDVGHYGVFNGSRFRADIAPRIADFFRSVAFQDKPAARKAG